MRNIFAWRFPLARSHYVKKAFPFMTMKFNNPFVGKEENYSCNRT